MNLAPTIPIIPLENAVLLPGCILRVSITSAESVHLVSSTLWQVEERGLVGFVPQATSLSDATNPLSLLHCRGTAARVIRVARTARPSPSFLLLVQGTCRFELTAMERTKPFPVAKVRQLDEFAAITATDQPADAEMISDLADQLRARARELVALLGNVRYAQRIQELIERTAPPRLADIFMSMVEASYDERLAMLDAVQPVPRLKLALELLQRQMQMLSLTQRLNHQMESSMNRSQRTQSLREQLKAIQEELRQHGGLPSSRPGNGSASGSAASASDEDDGALRDLEAKLQEAALPEEVRAVAEREMARLRRMNAQQSEYSVTRTYLECIAEVPWTTETEDSRDLAAARAVLDADHCGLDTVKKRLVEFLAVRCLAPHSPAPILLLVGPPGVGKTSLGQSVARALQRNFQRVSLGGVRDEAEIRGHRRTYVAAMPGRLVAALKRARSRNPVLLLDEVDKLTRDSVRGDPSAALLEVLDPEQNNSFTDHYLALPLDLSRVLFIATANDTSSIPAPLLDRMELIEIPGYTVREKMEIGRKHLWERQVSRHGLKSAQVRMRDDALEMVIERYTREAGVRGLERHLAALCRMLAVDAAEHMEEETQYVIDCEAVERCLGAGMYENELASRVGVPGVATGLVWTTVGGKIMFVEATQMGGGKGALTLTGSLGKVIKESARIALNWVRANAFTCGLAASDAENVMDGVDVHVHFPSGAVPKDGPSAGVTLVTVLVSLLSDRVVRSDTAMTGEVTLTGRVLPVGGVKEKVIAAHRAGVKRVILPRRNMKDLKEVPDCVRDDIVFIPVDIVDDVLAAAFDGGFRLLHAKL